MLPLKQPRVCLHCQWLHANCIKGLVQRERLLQLGFHKSLNKWCEGRHGRACLDQPSSCLLARHPMVGHRHATQRPPPTAAPPQAPSPPLRPLKASSPATASGVGRPREVLWASLDLLGASLELLGTSLELLGASLELRGAALELLGAPRPRRCALCASSDAEHRGAHEVPRRLPVHEFGHCVWRAICRVLENPLHGLSEIKPHAGPCASARFLSVGLRALLLRPRVPGSEVSAREARAAQRSQRQAAPRADGRRANWAARAQRQLVATRQLREHRHPDPRHHRHQSWAAHQMGWPRIGPAVLV